MKKPKIDLVTIATVLTILAVGGSGLWGSMEIINKAIAVAEEVKTHSAEISILQLQNMVDNTQIDYYRAKGIVFDHPEDQEAVADFEEVQRDYRALRDRLREARLKIQLNKEEL